MPLPEARPPLALGPAVEAPKPVDQDNEAFQLLTNEMYAMKKELDKLKWLKNVQEEGWAEADQEGYVLNDAEIEAAACAVGYEVGEGTDTEEEDQETPRGNGGQTGTTGAFTAPVPGAPLPGGEPRPTGAFTASAAGGTLYPPGIPLGGTGSAVPAPLRAPTTAGPGPLGPHPPGLPNDPFHRAYNYATTAAIGTQGAAAALGVAPQIMGPEAGAQPGPGLPPTGGRLPVPLGCGYLPREACNNIGLRLANPVQGGAFPTPRG